jgi:hypothetical protein
MSNLEFTTDIIRYIRYLKETTGLDTVAVSDYCLVACVKKVFTKNRHGLNQGLFEIRQPRIKLPLYSVELTTYERSKQVYCIKS